ncbi:MAG TPA: glycoside hydrolase domain-containing protein [Gemmatimonadaceae bacterium]|nr:glycoside hydrolase domain-containing protein [Gemmatimonadaceae bacterium]
MIRRAATVGTSRTIRIFVSAAFAFAAACGASTTEPARDTTKSTVADVAAKVAQAAAAVTGQDAPIANNYEKGHYVGFDTHTYPGTATMKTWKNTPGSPYSWVGYYLPSPCHDDKSWTGKRDTLVAMGWGMAVVYVGEQTWGKTPRPLTAAQADAQRKKSDCSTDLVSAAEGTLNADDATAKTKAEGFPPGAVVFLDLERMETIPDAMRAYYRAWTARMLANGVYVPGFYAHEHNAQSIYDDVMQDFKAAGRTDEPRFWIAGGKGFDTGRAPQDVGYAFAGMWQGVIDVARSVANIKLPVDVNVGAWASPSESGTATQ